MGSSKKIAIIGAEVEENLGVRYILASLKDHGHDYKFIRFNHERDAQTAVTETMRYNPDLVGLSMVFTLRARDFVKLAMMLRQAGYKGHITAGGHFASFNHADLLTDFPCFDSICHGEGEWILIQLIEHLNNLDTLSGVSYRAHGTVKYNPIKAKHSDLGSYPFPLREASSHEYFNQPLRNILSGRGCYGACKFCSIHSWYYHIRLPHFRQRVVEDVLNEMKYCYDTLNTRIFNFHDDNFFLPTKEANKKRFKKFLDGFDRLGFKDIALSIKARPDSLSSDIVEILKALHVLRVFIGIENMSESGLQNLGRKLSTSDNSQALDALNNAGIQTAFNLLIFEPSTTLKDLEYNLMFMEHHLENPYNFCRTEIYNGTPLELELRSKGKLLGDYFGWDYVMADPQAENFFNIVNAVFNDRNFTTDGVQNTSMWIDYFYHVAQHFYPRKINRNLRALSKNFVKQVNLDNYQRMARIYDFIDKKSYENPSLMMDFIAQEKADIQLADQMFKANADQITRHMEQTIGAKATKN
ncbi:MAG: B12-binding domain-containing radical SAM protein [Candidatus Omnitrophota bacterium]